MDDDLDDYELFWSPIVTHFRLISKSVVNLSQIGVNWPTMSTISQSTHRLFWFVMRPQTLAFLSVIVVLALICHTFDYWLKCLTRSTINLVKRLNIGLTLATTALTTLLPNVDCLSNNVVEEYKDNLVGIYAIQGRRPKMEDKFTFVNDSDRLGIEYWAVFDGHGGDSAAIFAETHVYKAIERRVEALRTKNNPQNSKTSEDVCQSVDTDSEPDKQNDCTANAKSSSPQDSKYSQWSSDSLSVTTLSQIVTEEVLEVDKQLIVESKEKGDYSGTTALIGLRIVAQNKLIVANVGDSRGVICDSKGSAIPLSFDHKPQQIKEHKRIRDAGGFIKFNGVWRVAGILATSRAMGDYPLKDTNLVISEPDILTFDLNDIRPKFMILATDGLWDTFSNEEAVAFAKENLIRVKASGFGHMAHEVAKSLVSESYRRGSVDNVTVILVIFDTDFHDMSNS